MRTVICPYVPGRDDALRVDIQNRSLDEHAEYTPETLRDFELHRQGHWFDPAGTVIAELGVDTGSLTGVLHPASGSGFGQPAAG